ncbi:MAG TPA: PIG-L family deacetylase [Candidatus Angelobacter sp.]|nr:PIG-L family deacetylase [Candidatus Angelobacter sp.]
MSDFDALLGTTVILVAHPDDEVIGCGAIMQRMHRPVVVFATDGAPRDDYFWKHHGSREAYAEIRRQEARAAVAIAGAEPFFLADRVSGGIADQELFRRLPQAAEEVEKVLAEIRPDALLTLSYEGGHPDHDSACFIAAVVGRRRGLPVWESPLYHRDPHGHGVVQKFHQQDGEELQLKVEGEPMRRKVEMFHTYKSQKLVLDGFHPEIETFRPMANYDFTRPPMPWKLNYEVWQWSMTGGEVAAAFSEYLRSEEAVDARQL